MSSNTKPLVLIVGATGRTGGVIARTLLQEGNVRVAALVRAQSASKPAARELEEAGAELRIGDISEPPAKLEAFLQGVDVLISTVLAMVDQKPLFFAAKKVGVKRVIPSDFGPTAPEGVMEMHDLKLGVRQYIRDLGLGYTFIEEGWWTQLMFPYPHSVKESMLTPKQFVGDKHKKLIHISLRSIGLFVARIIADPRTLNQTVLIYDGEATTAEIQAVAEKVSGEDFSDYRHTPDEDILAGTKSQNVMVKVYSQYLNSLYIRGDNTLEAAFSRGALDGRKLYDDIPVPDIEEEAKRFYENPPIPEYDMSALEL